MLIKMLQVHDKPELWKFAARWEFRESKSIVNGRKFLLRGLRFHPESELLYAEVILFHYFSFFFLMNNNYILILKV